MTKLFVLLMLITVGFRRPKAPVALPILTLTENDLRGKWTTCTSTHRSGATESTITRNVCIAWLFNSYHTGFVGLQTPTSPFEWTLVSNTLYIKTVTSNRFISTGAYRLTEQKRKAGQTIIICDRANDNKYFLER